jgi:hypothetical protein
LAPLCTIVLSNIELPFSKPLLEGDTFNLFKILISIQDCKPFSFLLGCDIILTLPAFLGTAYVL